MKNILFLCLLIGQVGFAQINADSTQNKVKFPSDPLQAKFHTEDVELFWKIFDRDFPKLKGQTFQEDYIDQGSIGLKGFIKYRIESGKKLANTVKKNLTYYQNIRESSLAIAKKKETYYVYFQEFKKLYPLAVFPDIYFVIGRKNSGGTIFSKGLIIGAERYGEIGDKFQADIDINYLDHTIVHELVHFQQAYKKDRSLLAQCIREGAADFLAELITQIPSIPKTYTFGNAHKAALWEEFLSKKDGNSWYNWLYYSRDKSRPQDLGYWMGYQICKAYYDKATDKKQAIFDILNIQDFQDFFQKSGYQGT